MEYLYYQIEMDKLQH